MQPNPSSKERIVKRLLWLSNPLPYTLYETIVSVVLSFVFATCTNILHCGIFEALVIFVVYITVIMAVSQLTLKAIEWAKLNK